MATAIRHAQAEFETYEDTPRPELRFSTPASTVRDEPQKREWVHSHDRSPHTSNKRSKESSSRSNSYGTTQPHRDPRVQQAPQTPPPPRYEVFTILNASYETIWNENKDEILGPPPRKFLKSKLTQQDTGKFCTYHEDVEHNTNLCVALKNTIESLIQRGKLQRYLHAKEIGAIDVYGQIFTIHGGGPKEFPPQRKKRNSSFGRPKVFNFHKAPQQDGGTGWTSVTFLQEEEADLKMPHDDPFLITLQMDHYIMSRVLVDTGAPVRVLFRDAYKALNRGRAKLSQDNEPLISFSGDIVQPLGSDYLSITVGESLNCSTIKTEFIIVDCVSSYNAILGRPALWRLKTFIAGHMLMMKVPTPAGITTIRGDQAAARKCYSLTVSRGRGKSEMLHVATNPEREGLISFLRSNTSAFAWSYEDMPGIPTKIATHNLSIVPYSTPVRQKRRAFTHYKYRAIQVEVKKLMAINFVREVTYPRWLANVVMVPKKSPGSWRMCVDYTNLNRACPKDSFMLPRIDQLIESTVGYRLLSFMDAFSGYNQIRMNPADEEHTTFTTDKGLYCYQVMPFGLKNAGATYQRLVNSMFEEVIDTIMEVYVDDMQVKSLTPDDHVTNLSIVFTIILRNGMRLNPQTCIFGVKVGKFLGYIISHRGIEANPEKHVEVIAWTAEHEAAFLGLKAYLSEVPLLYKPVPGEMLYIYLAASSTAVSSVLIRKDSDCEYPVYYAGKGYTGAESRYPDIEKVALAFLVSAWKLRHYFQAYSITVFTNHPLRQVLQKPETSGRLIKWAIELGEFDIKYHPRTAIKGQAAADFISESIPFHNPPLESPEPLAPDPPPPSTCPDDQVYEYALKFAFKASNNAAEYEALIAGLQIARELWVQHLGIISDSQLVVNQVSGNFEAKEPHMSSYKALARALVQRFTSYSFTQIPRAENDKADALAKLASTSPSPTYGATKVEILK
ncbi:uncharacterized protein LOC112170691 [Rosa chinensis]|uniref:uncharacterized protein LOC112170691 n=1 Tax=Rosa chinensis TaxID=74649 RepID=UPI000D087EA0|nr:uncharacterized protein LOC112170691 [Rosa chinensis]